MPNYPNSFSDRSISEGFGDRPSVISWIPKALRASVYDGTITADVSSYIQAAHDDLDAGQDLFFPNGTYPLLGSGAAAVTISKNISLIGAHTKGVIFGLDPAMPNTRDAFLLSSSGELRNTQLRNFSILGTRGPSKAITGVSNASPMRVEAIAHGYSTGQVLLQSGILNSGGGSSSANGKHLITVIDADHYDLYNWSLSGRADIAVPNASTPNGTYSSGGTAQALPGRHALAFDITNAVAYSKFEHLALQDSGGYSLSTLPSSPPSRNGNYFVNRHYDCQFNDGVNMDSAGDSLSFICCESSGDNVAFRFALAWGANVPSIINHNSVAWRGLIDLVTGDRFTLMGANAESNNPTAYPQEAFVVLGSGAPVSATIAASITGSQTAQVLTLANVTGITVGSYVAITQPGQYSESVFVEAVSGVTITGVVTLSFFGPGIQVGTPRPQHPSLDGGCNFNVSGSVIRAVKFDNCDNASPANTQANIGLGGTTKMFWITANASGTTVPLSVTTDFPGTNRRLQDDSDPNQSNPTVVESQAFPGPNTGARRDAAGNLQAFGFVAPLAGTMGRYQNLIVGSRAYEGATWGRNDCTITSTAQTAPNGSSTGRTLTESTDSVATLHYVAQGRSKAPTIQSYSVAFWVKANVRSACYAQMNSALGGSVLAHFDLTGASQPTYGSGGGFANPSAYLLSNPQWGTWRLCVLIGDSDADTTLQCLVAPEDVFGTSTYIGTGANAIDLWDASLQDGRSPGTVLLTTSSAIGGSGALTGGVVNGNLTITGLADGALEITGGVVSSSPTAAAITALTGDVMATGPGSAVATLVAVVTAGTYTVGARLTPTGTDGKLTIDAKGRVTGVNSAT
jgi:hypothetical protein